MALLFILSVQLLLLTIEPPLPELDLDVESLNEEKPGTCRLQA